MIPGQAQQFFEAAAAQAGGYEIERSLRFNDNDSAYLNRTPSSASNRKTWTWSGWVKRSSSTSGNMQVLFAAGPDNDDFALAFDTDDRLHMYEYDGSFTWRKKTDQVFRDFSAWYHIVAVLDTSNSTAEDRARLYVNGVRVTAWNVDSDPSLDFATTQINAALEHRIGQTTANTSRYLDGYLAEVHFVDGQALAASDFGEYDDNNIWQPSAYSGSYGTNGFYLKFDDTSSAAALGTDSSGNGNDWTVNNFLINSPQYDTSAITSVGTSGSNTLLEFTNNTNFDQFAVSTIVGGYRGTGTFTTTKTSNSVFNQIFSTSTGGRWTTQDEANASFTCRFFFDPPVAISSNVTYTIEGHYDGQQHYMTFYNDSGGSSATWAGTGGSQTQSFSGNLAEMRLTGSIGGNAKPIVLYGVKFDNVIPDLTSPNIFDIDLAQIVSKSPSSTPPSMVVTGPTSNFSNGDVLTIDEVVGDDMIDSPTDYEAASGNNGGNYATLNSLDQAGSSTLSNGNLDIGNSSSSNAWGNVRATIGAKSGKYYAEYTCTVSTQSPGQIIGVVSSTVPNTGASATNVALNNLSDSAAYFNNGTKSLNGTTTSYGASWTVGDVIGIALDVDNTTVTFYKNGTSQGAASTALASDALLTFGGGVVRNSEEGSFNFGQRPFTYTPPTGYVSLCTQNLSEPTIADGSTEFDAVAYSGNGGTQSITGVNFSPDFLWFKRRQSPARFHMLYDTVRGASGNKVLASNSTNAEGWDTATYGQLDSADSNGFTVTTGSNTDDNINSNNDTYISWLWDAGSSTVSNTDGSITSSVRANASAGFSIVSYTGNGVVGATVGHGLGANVALYFVKNRTTANSWGVLGHALNDAFGGSQKYLNLDSTGAAGIASQGPGNSSTIELYDDASNNSNGDDFIAYCFASVEGYSAFGSYVSNNNVDGPFVYTGFQPKLVGWKNLDAAHGWYFYDDEREPSNPHNDYIELNSSNAEGNNGGTMDILSNGFKVRNTGADMNANSNKILYMAWAEHPFKTARAR